MGNKKIGIVIQLADKNGVTISASQTHYKKFCKTLMEFDRSKDLIKYISVAKGSVVEELILQKIPRPMKVEVSTNRHVLITSSSYGYGWLTGITSIMSEHDLPCSFTVCSKKHKFFVDTQSIDLTLKR
jgi:hypothetical protein